MRKIYPYPEIKLFLNESDIDFNAQFIRGNVIHTDAIENVSMNDMFNGETRIDKFNERPVTKVDGVLKKLVVENNEIKFQEI